MQLGPLEQHWSRNTQLTVWESLTGSPNPFTTRTGKKQQEGNEGGGEGSSD